MVTKKKIIRKIRKVNASRFAVLGVVSGWMEVTRFEKSLNQSIEIKTVIRTI